MNRRPNIFDYPNPDNKPRIINVNELSPELCIKVTNVYNYLKNLKDKHIREQKDNINYDYYLEKTRDYLFIRNNPTSPNWQPTQTNTYMRCKIDLNHYDPNNIDVSFGIEIDYNSEEYISFAKKYEFESLKRFIYNYHIYLSDGALILGETYANQCIIEDDYMPSSLSSKAVLWLSMDLNLIKNSKKELFDSIEFLTKNCRYCHRGNSFDDLKKIENKKILDKELAFYCNGHKKLKSWSYPTKINGKQITINYEKIKKGYYSSWYVIDDVYYGDVLQTTVCKENSESSYSGGFKADAFKKLYSRLAKKEICSFKDQIDPCNRLARNLISFIDGNNLDIINSVINGELPFVFSENFNNFLGQISDNRINSCGFNVEDIAEDLGLPKNTIDKIVITEN